MTSRYFDDLSTSVAHALKEDVGDVDITAQLIDKKKEARAEVIFRDQALICGRPWVDEVFKQVNPDICIEWQKNEGSKSSAGDLIFRVQGNARSLLTAERPALNFLQTLSATATVTSHYAKLIAHTETKLLDTRKTIPGLRLAQKYAVVVGGGMNHRIGLYDAFLIKENHILACGSISEAIIKARKLYPDRRVEVEVESMTELDEAISAKPDWIMLDNFSFEDIRTAVALIEDKAETEASGGITLDTLRNYAECGVEFISVGALTHSVQNMDLSLKAV